MTKLSSNPCLPFILARFAQYPITNVSFFKNLTPVRMTHTPMSHTSFDESCNMTHLTVDREIKLNLVKGIKKILFF